jgi:hypothetical protein
MTSRADFEDARRALSYAHERRGGHTRAEGLR